jgi:hypothetical protein
VSPASTVCSVRSIETTAPFATFEMRSAAMESVYEGHRLILIRPDLHVVWRVDRLLNPDVLAALAAGYGNTAVMREVG